MTNFGISLKVFYLRNIWQWLYFLRSWWRHQMETFSALLALCAGNSPVSGEFPALRPVTRSFDVFFDVHLIKLLNKHSRGWWFETLSGPLWRHHNDVAAMHDVFCKINLFTLTVISDSSTHMRWYTTIEYPSYFFWRWVARRPYKVLSVISTNIAW